MWQSISGFVSLVRAVLDLWKMFLQWQRQQAVKQAEEKHEQLKQAIEQSKVAESDDEIWKSQEKIAGKQ